MISEDNNAAKLQFEAFLKEENFLGAWSLLKSWGLEHLQEGIWIGALANAIQQANSRAFQVNDKEKLYFYRSILSWILRDFPGLASLYREQIRQQPSFIPDGFVNLWQDFSDILSGRKSLDEEFRQRMEDAARIAREKGIDTDSFSNNIKNIENGLRHGFSEARYYFENFFDPTTKASSESPPHNQSATNSTTNETVIKVHIQATDNPEPKKNSPK